MIVSSVEWRSRSLRALLLAALSVGCVGSEPSSDLLAANIDSLATWDSVVVVAFDPRECLACDGYLTAWNARRLAGERVVFVATREPGEEETRVLRRWRLPVHAVIRLQLEGASQAFLWRSDTLINLGSAQQTDQLSDPATTESE